MADQPADEPPADEPAADETEDDAGDGSADDGRPARGPRGGGNPGRAVSVADDGAGWVLGLILWAGIALPFLQGGPAGVKAWWMAKFFNKAPDGSELP